ncbi:MAG: CapA family protein, partial [Aeriscardovia sp.]|nr:CapA family protein [Aeriscardovia sp.]
MLFFCGDVNLTDWDFNFGFGIGSRIGQGFNPFEKIIRTEDDIWVGNFEGVASSTTIRRRMSAEVFRVMPDKILSLRHLNYYGFANNHAMQHGEEAYRQTVDTLTEIGCGVFGSKEKRSTFFIHQNRKISLTGACFRIDEFTEQPLYWYNPEYIAIQDEINSLPNDAFKVFFVHWGNEYIDRPSVQQRKFAHWLIDAGFDLIIGMHPHVLQGFEDYKGKRIYYSLGKFVFDMVWEPCRYGAVIGV